MFELEPTTVIKLVGLPVAGTCVVAAGYGVYLAMCGDDAKVFR